MKTSHLILLGLVIGLGIGASYYFFENGFKGGTDAAHENPLMATTGMQTTAGATTTTTTTTTAASASSALTFTWEFKNAPKAGDPYTYTQVSLVAGGKTHPVGTYQGSCKMLAAGETGVVGDKADADELSPRVQCYFAGAGDEIGLFKNGTGYAVKVGELQEGIEGGAAFRGNFKATIPLN